ncbi:MAG: type II toxin-antitoxin system VapC family toxin [Verrucomicrobiota bacterium]|nr:type II toxin-antitoxin system VapC family toxin [Verrucomicrobiota bacterium]
MSFLLDTCAISELRRPMINKGFLNWFKEIEDRELFISSLTMGEIEFGIFLLDDEKKKAQLMLWFERLKDSFDSRILPITSKIALRWGELRAKTQKKGRKTSIIDGLIVATAIEHDFILISRNVSDSEVTMAKVISPWTK